MKTSQTNHRKSRVDAVRRDLIKEAAKKLFATTGLDGASVREIARLAGYTTGALYFHYPSKEELYADILGDSLSALLERVQAAAGGARPLEGLSNAFRALVGFYEERPRDLDLSLYLFHGARPRGLTPVLNRVLNEKLASVLAVFREALVDAGVKETQLDVEIGCIFTQMIGSLVSAQTGRLRVLGTDLSTVVEHHIAGLVARLGSGLKRA
jgi:AcrR family transcriptional regulator